jgi:hypothetical protein
MTAPRGPASFRQSDVTRAIRATRKAGVVPSRVEIDRNGKIIIIAGTADPVGDEEPNEWDRT